MRYLATISYDGSKFYGFQRLNNENSVQGELERALSKINKKDVVVKGSGRTDRGVHSRGQCVHFDLDIKISPERLVNAVNSILSCYVRFLDCKVVSDDFHARFMVREKTYRYVINMGEFDPIRHDYIYNYGYNLDIKSMKKASRSLIGKHSYKVFVSGERDNYNGEIYSVRFVKEGNYLNIIFKGKSFYRYMVRNMVGALMLVGRGKISVKDFYNMVDSDESKYTYITVPSNGLYLESVKY